MRQRNQPPRRRQVRQTSSSPQPPKRNTVSPLQVLFIVSAVVGVLSFAGITLQSLFSGTNYPTADQILQRARIATYQDMICTHTEVYLHQVGTWSGTCDFISTPQRAKFIFYVQTSPTAASISMIFDTASETVYTQDSSHPNWVKGPPDCQAGEVCPPAFLGSLNSLYNVTAPQFVGVDSVHNADTYHIQGQLQSPMLSSPATEDMWFLQDNYYPVRLVVHDVTSAGATIPPTTYTLDFTGYNQGVTITLPTTYQNQP